MSRKYYFQIVLIGLAITLSSVLATAADYRVPVGSCDAGGIIVPQPHTACMMLLARQ
ncbi:MAG: hypothetical protein QME42_09320 [bacterium]|nr:hypothetical protein [bacterium]